MPNISNTSRIISPLESPQNGTQPGSLLEVFPTLRTSPYFFHVPFIAIQRTLVGHSGNEWEMFGFHSFLTILRGARHLHFSPGESPQNRHFPNLVCFPLFLPYSLHCHPKLSRKYRERKVVCWTLVVLASTLQKKGWQRLPKLHDTSNNCNLHFLQKAFRQTPPS